jgi:protein SCO1
MEAKKPFPKKAIILILILLFPSLFYIFLTSGKHNIMRLPIYGPKQPVEVTENGETKFDTIYHTIPEFEFTNQYGEKITLAGMKGKIAVVDYFFTTCESICPKMADQLYRVQYKFQDMKDLVIFSHSVNPENDSVPVLLAYAKKKNAIKGKWHFLTGDKKELYDQARNGYYITAMEGDGGPDDFIHSEKLILIDKQGQIRGYYDGTDREDVERLIDEIKVLKASELIPKKGK